MTSISFSSSIGQPITLSPHQRVDLDTILAHTTQSEGFRLQVAQELGIPNDKIFLHMSKIVGDTVETNEIIASKKSAFGSKDIASPLQGTIKEIDHETGTLVIETATNTSNIVLSWFEGEVEQYRDGVITLKVKHGQQVAVKDVTHDFGGRLLLITEEQLRELTEEQVTNAVVCVPTLHPAEAVRLDVLGARGIVTRENIKEKDDIASAQLDDETQWGTLSDASFTHCLVDKKNSTMYLYTPQP